MIELERVSLAAWTTCLKRERPDTGAAWMDCSEFGCGDEASMIELERVSLVTWTTCLRREGPDTGDGGLGVVDLSVAAVLNVVKIVVVGLSSTACAGGRGLVGAAVTA